MKNTDNQGISAGVIVIGDEILSGRTQDENIRTIAKYLGGKGIELMEVAIVRDDKLEISQCVKRMKDKYKYLFTTGGIGPTHDDVTAEAIGLAFNLEVKEHKQAVDILGKYYKRAGVEFNENRRKMTMMPVGAKLIENKVSGAPGFCIENVFVMAGVPKIMKDMISNISHELENGLITLSNTIKCTLPEGEIANELKEIQSEFKNKIAIGSYPKFKKMKNNEFLTEIIVKGKNKNILDKATKMIKNRINDKIK